MKFSSKTVDDILVITIDGEVMGDTKNGDFHQFIYDAVEKDQTCIVIDLEAAKWMNSSGLGVLISALSTVRSCGGDLRMANLSERVRRPLVITKLDSVFNIYDSVSAAVASFAELK